MLNKIFACLLGLTFLGMFAATPVEARTHFGFSFGAAVAPRPVCYAPCYVEEYYAPVVVPGPYCECDNVCVGTRVYAPAPVVVRPVYVPQPRSFFSFGFFR